VIVCDGCSSSENTDLGSRILAFAAKKLIKKYLDIGYYHDTYISQIYRRFGNWVINLSKESVSMLNLNNTCLDSTLVIAFEWNKKINIFMYGDGGVFSLSKDGKKSINKISYLGNAPYYLSYLIDENRKDLYKEFANQTDGLIKTEIIDGLKKEVRYDQPTIFSYNTEDLSLLLITSDGSESFVDFNTVEKVPCEAIANELMCIKSKKGEFIKRRSIRLIEDLSKQNTFNTDDFSVGAIMVEE
jgi:hypothetical protein